MKKIFFNIYFIVPLIFGLYTVFSFVVTYRITGYFADEHGSGKFFFAAAGCLIFLLSLAIGYVLTRFILKPSETFIEKIKDSQAVRTKETIMDEPEHSPDEMEKFTRIFNQAAHALTNLDNETLFPDIVAKSRAMHQVLAQVAKVARTDATVLICGDSGTGKELVAGSIVEHSSRKDNPFITINCAAVSPNLMESELFGHERGSFTGAVAQKQGCFEQADGGTLFLDEIGDMPLELQVKLLRVLQEQSFLRVGGDTVIKVNVRILAATNKNLETMIRKGSFREELFYRINVFPIFLPPLRERQEDVEVLAIHFLSCNAPGKKFDPAALDLLKGHSWPGNVRELQNIVERAVVLADAESVVGCEHLPDLLKSTRDKVQAFSAGTALKVNGLSLDETLIEFEKTMICEALKSTGGVQVKAANILGIKQRSLWNRVKKYKIDVNAFR
ncbi:sigma-54 interaction domain-containing protein [Desulfobacula phenolica]|uniref:Nif-specific regulatory protein n=1 Tax=Desulfobacula phenolica TaxID=90732 RepID=A0A1H2FTX9_9BACT|nr:sigma-54 dependent transcriptional regulator [Desulfobacula phenolica]SDU10418.1 Nif-specific regulatory protein [Desulfobacula phenolica]